MNPTAVWFSALYLITICVGMHPGHHADVTEGLKKNFESILKEIVFRRYANTNDITINRSRREANTKSHDIAINRSRRAATDSLSGISGQEMNDGQRTTEMSFNSAISNQLINFAAQRDSFANLTEVSEDLIDTNLNMTDATESTQFGWQTTLSNQSSRLEGNITTDKDRGKVSSFQDGLVTKDVFDAIHALVLKASLPLQIIAILLCFCSVVVYSMKSMKCPTSVYLISINVTEMFYSISGLTVYIAGDIYGNKAMVSYYYLSIGLYLSNYVAVALRRSTFCTTSLVSAERMIAVAFPLKSKHFRLSRNPALIVVLTIFSSFVYHVFSALKYVVVSYISPANNETLWKFAFTDLKDPIESWSLSSKVIFVYAPLILTLLLNVGIVLAMRKHNQARRNLNINVAEKSENKERQTTIVILVSTFAFVFLALPTVTNSLVSNLATGYGPYTKEHYTFFSIMRIGEFCELLSSIMNFVFYMTLSSKFRRAFSVVFPCFRSRMSKSGPASKTVTSLTSITSTAETYSTRTSASEPYRLND